MNVAAKMMIIAAEREKLRGAKLNFENVTMEKRDIGSWVVQITQIKECKK
jgi:hypothetical protein